MKSYLSVLLAGVVAAAFTAAAAAATSAAALEKIPGVFPIDCAKWKDKPRCEALNRNIEACREKTDDEWRECMHLPAPSAKFTPPKPRDCSTASNKARCEAYNSALAGCNDKPTRAEHRKCVDGQLQAQAGGKS